MKMMICFPFILLLLFGCKDSSINQIPKNIHKYKNISEMDTLFNTSELWIRDCEQVYSAYLSSYIQSDPRSNLYLCSLNEIYKFDSSGNYLKKLSRVGDGPGEYSTIRTFCLDSSGAIYVADSRPEIIIYDSNFTYLRNIKTKVLNNYGYLSVKENYLLCFSPISTDFAVHVYDIKTGELINKFGEEDELAFKFNSLISWGGLYVDKDTIYYINAHSYKIYKYSIHGELLKEIEVNSKKFVPITKKRGNLLKTKTFYSLIVGLTMLGDMFLVTCVHPAEGNNRGKFSYDLVTQDGLIIAESKKFRRAGSHHLIEVSENTFLSVQQSELTPDKEHKPLIRLYQGRQF